MSQSKEQEALRLISEKVKQAYSLINECEKIADEAGVEFDFSVEYGMGGTYLPQSLVEEEGWGQAGWNPSSHSC